MTVTIILTGTLLQVWFVCDGSAMTSDTSSRGVDSSSGSSYLSISVTVRKGRVLDTLEEFSCICRANSTRGQADSPPANVALACKRNP